jgi:glycosyltransferase involved in cell wall biosynthesis
VSPAGNAVAAVIPAHPARLRNGMLARALDSVLTQSPAVDHVSVAVDRDGDGAAVTRDRALHAVPEWCDWVAFLDSDDTWKPNHIERMLAYAVRHEADYVYSWFMIKDATGREQLGWDPFTHFGRAFDPNNPVQTTVTTLVRRELAQKIGFMQPEGMPWSEHTERIVSMPTPDGHAAGEDWRFTLGCMAAGAKIVHLPERTWYWYHHGRNSSGQPDRGDASPAYLLQSGSRR